MNEIKFKFFGRNLILALRDLSIRGDFHTTVEYLITLLETKRFKENQINTAWLDELIAERVRSSKPDLMLAVVAGALHIGYRKIVEFFNSFRKNLEK